MGHKVAGRGKVVSIVRTDPFSTPFGLQDFVDRAAALDEA